MVLVIVSVIGMGKQYKEKENIYISGFHIEQI